MTNIKTHMVQYGVWPNCCNNCDFCLRENRQPVNAKEQIRILQFIRKNIRHIDWKDKFSAGISLLGGELYYIKDKTIQDEFLMLIDDIISLVLLPNKENGIVSRYSTVTNGLYEPTFLYNVIDRIVDAVGIESVDINFSYDLKYRYASQQDEQLVLENINNFHSRYNYKVGIQMILTQYVIDYINSGVFSLSYFLDHVVPGNNFCFLYPHKVKTGKTLPDFNFRRTDFLKFIQSLEASHPQIFNNFIFSTKYSALFKYTGYHIRTNLNEAQQPVLCDDKEVINTTCGHSILYQCYSDCDNCMLCDLENMYSILI